MVTAKPIPYQVIKVSAKIDTSIKIFPFTVQRAQPENVPT